MNCPAGLFSFLLFTTGFRTLAFTRLSLATPESSAKPDAFIGRLRNLSGVPDSRSHTASETQFVPLGISRQLLCFRVLRRKGSCGKGQVRAGQFVPGFLAVLSHFQVAKTRKNGFGTNQIGNARFGEIWHTFLEKCKISCKIIEAALPHEHWVCALPPENDFRQMQDFGPILCSIFPVFNNLYNFSGKHGGSPGPNSKQRRTQK